MRGKKEVVPVDTQQLLMILLQIATPVLSAAVAWYKAKASAKTSRNKALEDGVRALLRRAMVEDYERYYTNREANPLTVERRQEIDDDYEAYCGLCGDDHDAVVETMYAAIKTLPVTMVNGKKEI